MSVTEDEPALLLNQRVAFVGKLGGMNRREAQQLVRRFGGMVVDSLADAELIVIGADELPLGDEEEALDEATRQAAGEGRVEILSETQLWQRLGLVESEQHVRQLHTPAMLARLLGVPVSVVRSWHRRKLIIPAREVHRLPYFDFREVTQARQLAKLVAAGASPARIERQLAELARFVPEAERPLAQLPVLIEGRRVLLRQGGGLMEPSGQRRIDFEEPGETQSIDSAAPLADVALPPETPDQMLAAAVEADEAGDLALAENYYRAALAATGPTAEVCFQLADLLYRQGDLAAARERYYMAIELDENYVEARANLGCVLAELGQTELALAAFDGALAHHADYPDAHYHLARLLEEQGRAAEALPHWQAFLALAPDSPWADEARDRV